MKRVREKEIECKRERRRMGERETLGDEQDNRCWSRALSP